MLTQEKTGVSFGSGIPQKDSLFRDIRRQRMRVLILDRGRIRLPRNPGNPKLPIQIVTIRPFIQTKPSPIGMNIIKLFV
jgi:hypothetical protein